MSTETKKETSAEVSKQSTALQNIVVDALQISNKNLPIIAEKVRNAKAVGSLIVKIDTDDLDEYARKFLVKANATETEIEALRMAITKPMDQYKKDVMSFEKELGTEKIRIKTMRDAYATEKARKKKEDDAAIEKTRLRKEHESHVKSEMKAKLGLSIGKKLEDLETAIVDLFGKADLSNVDQLTTKLNIKPSLKEDFYLGCFVVPYSVELMTEEEFNGLKKRAADFFNFETTNKAYIEQATKIIDKWKAAVPGRKKDLQTVAKVPEENKAAAQAAADGKIANAQSDIKRKAEETKTTVQNTAVNEKSEATLETSFEAQKQTYATTGGTFGARESTVYRIDPKAEKDMLKVSQLIGKAVLHILSEPNNRDGIFKRDENGFPKRDEKGLPIYVDGIAYWLKALKVVGYPPQIDGLISTIEISTTAIKK